jgi:hypothetical protein
MSGTVVARRYGNNNSLESLTATSSLIVLAEVTSVEPLEVDYLWEAKAKVLEVLKGASDPVIRYQRSADIADDASKASVGERVLLFLWRDAKSGSSPVLRINAMGQGRMPVLSRNGRECVQVPTGIKLPAHIPMLEPGNAEQGRPAVVDLQVLRQALAPKQ